MKERDRRRFQRAPGDEVESRELLKTRTGSEALRTVTALVRTDIFRARGGSREDHNGRRVEELRPVDVRQCEHSRPTRSASSISSR